MNKLKVIFAVKNISTKIIAENKIKDQPVLILDEEKSLYKVPESVDICTQNLIHKKPERFWEPYEAIELSLKATCSLKSSSGPLTPLNTLTSLPAGGLSVFKINSSLKKWSHFLKTEGETITLCKGGKKAKNTEMGVTQILRGEEVSVAMLEEVNGVVFLDTGSQNVALRVNKVHQF